MKTNYFNKPISKTFLDAFPKFEKVDPNDTKKYFYEIWQSSPFFDSTITKEELKSIYNHLLARYYNWHYIFVDDIGIALNTMEIIHEYYPNVKERLKLVQEMRDLTIEEFSKSGIVIDSSGSNPKTAEKMDELISLVDSQNASFQLKSKEQALKAKFMSLYDGVMDQFMDRFRDLFVKLYNGLTTYVYENKEEEV